jgi:hypothetical protein
VHLLRQQIARVRRQTRWLLLLYALGRVIGACVAISIALVSIDYFLRYEDRGLRIASTFIAACAFGWTLRRYLVPALHTQLDDVHLARRVEQRYPELTDRLSSSLNFLNQREDDQQAGSSELRRAVIAEATAEVEHLNWSAVLDRRRLPATYRCKSRSYPTCMAMEQRGLAARTSSGAARTGYSDCD